MSKNLCRYGASCYRKNPQHFEEFSHPEDNGKLDTTVEPKHKKIKVDDADYCSGSGTSSKSNSKKYLSLYLSKVRGLETEFNKEALSLKDILEKDAQHLQKSYQFNYMAELDWLLDQYPKQTRKLPLCIIYNTVSRDDRQYLEKSNMADSVKLIAAKLPIAYGTHHTKMMILFYDNFARIVIHTANLISQDWDQKTQGIFISPNLPKTKSSTLIDSPTNFGADLIDYLKNYKLTELDELSSTLIGYDLSAIKVFLISSTPGRFLGSNINSRGHLKLKSILKSHFKPEDQKNQLLIAQFSSIGSLGSSADNWLMSEFRESLSASSSEKSIKNKELALIFPCVDDVRNSLEGYMAGTSLPYSIKTAEKQTYLKSFLHKWKSDLKGRSKASPHIKSYCLIDKENNNVLWFLLTSANLSKAAWGVYEKQKSQLMIRSYELGILFLPSFFDNQDRFELNDILPFDFPLAKYDKKDEPWIYDRKYEEPDSQGNVWCPD